ncbi:MAG: hypothetical protein NZ918_02800 [Aigarchaeota archaeon]|nr:hypothetical protein [Aigarchaeota archaeon]
MRLESLVAGVRAVLAKRLATEHGYGNKKIAEALGLSLPAVTLYLKGRRAFHISKELLKNERAMKYIDGLIEKIKTKGPLTHAELYDAAFNIIGTLQAGVKSAERRPEPEDAEVAPLLKSLKERIQAEQESAEEFMRAAVELKSDFMRMIFRILASDCIRHADIIMTVVSAIEEERMIQVDKFAIKRLNTLVEKEEKAHLQSLDGVKHLLPSGLITVLIELIEDDERKHSKILKKIMKLVEY